MKVTCTLLLLCMMMPVFAQEAVELALPVTDTATLMFKSQGDAMDVVFHTSTDPQPCEGLIRAAGVYDAVLLKEKLLPFIARMQQKTRAVLKVYPSVEMKVKGGVPLRVLGGSNWAGSGAGVTTFGKCGLFTEQFTPQAGRIYQVLFKFSGNSCSQSVLDTTDATDIVAATPVGTTALQCTRPFFK